MSCMDVNYKLGSNCDLINKVLEQGQRLRNSMVRTILKNDPFNKEILNNYVQTQQNICNVSYSDSGNCCNKRNREYNELSDHERSKLTAYLQGDEMPLNEETETLEILHSMRPDSIIQLTSRSVKPTNKKHCCHICQEYNQRKFVLNSSESFERVPSVANIETPNEQFHEKLLKHVDSLKVFVYSVKLNSAGNRKISNKNTNKLFFTSDRCYFVQYKLPDILTIKDLSRSKSRINTGLDANKTVRFCSKKCLNDCIYFKQDAVHSVAQVQMLDLNGVNVEFEVCCRSVRERTVVVIGKALFNMGSLVTNECLTSNQEVVVTSDNSPVVLGTVKLMLQFGCEKLHFGKDFVDAINCAVETKTLSDNDSICKNVPEKTIKSVESVKQTVTNKKPKLVSNYVRPVESLVKVPEKEWLLYGVIYIPEAKFVGRSLNSYLISRGFRKDDTLSSKIVFNDFNPEYKFYQSIPILLNESVLHNFRDNYIVIEVWEKGKDIDALIGICKLPLHQFYIAYRNAEIVKYLIKNDNPVISVDSWESIVDPLNNDENGQLRATVALGTQIQITNFNISAEKPQNDPITYKNLTTNTVDASTQSEIIMDSDKSEQTAQNSAFMTQKELLNSFMDQILNHKNKCVENSTNTEEEVVKPSPTVILDVSKQEIVAPNNGNEEEQFFKAHVCVENAVQSTGAFKTSKRRSKNKSETSVYVTYKEKSGLISTPLVPKTKNIEWNFRSDVYLPVNLLLDNQKRLIFKIHDSSQLPNKVRDTITGYVGVDLTALLAGLPSIKGWFGIFDFTHKCNGTIQIHITPLEDLSKYKNLKRTNIPEKISAPPPKEITEEIPSELLSRALKRKFTELDEITQRLKQRLSTVTNDDSGTSNDDFAEEFERDLNTECMETNTLFNDELLSPKTTNINEPSCSKSDSISVDSINSDMERTKPLSNLDSHLIEEKIKINSLLEKLSLMNDDSKNSSFASRYVSGCSTNEPNEIGDVMKAFNLDFTSGLESNLVFNPMLFQQLFAENDSCRDIEQLTLENLISSSDCSSVDAQTATKNTLRQAPDGEGNVSDS